MTERKAWSLSGILTRLDTADQLTSADTVSSEEKLSDKELAQTAETIYKELVLRLGNTPEFVNAALAKWFHMTPDNKRDSCILFVTDGYAYAVYNHLNRSDYSYLMIQRVPEKGPVSMFDHTDIAISSIYFNRCIRCAAR